MTAINDMTINANGTKTHTETMMYVGTTPWHGEGVYVGAQAVDAATALRASGLDWRVSVEDLFLGNGLSAAHKARAVVRQTDGKILGVVGSSYHAFQNAESFDFLDSLVKEGELEYHTAGSLKGGEVIWILAKLPGGIFPLDGDKTSKFILLTNAHDGSQALRVYFTPVRVVCCNTLAMAASGRNKLETASIRHTGKLSQRLEAARKTLGIANQTYEDYAALAMKMAHTQMGRAAWDIFLDEAFPASRRKDGSLHPKSQGIRDAVTGLFNGGAKGSDIPGIGGTVWQALNAVTEYTNHHRETRQKSRAESLWMGGSAKTNSFALSYLGAFTEENHQQRVVINGGRVDEARPQALFTSDVPMTEALAPLTNAPAGERFGGLELD